MNLYRVLGRPILLALALGDTERAHWLAIRAGVAIQAVPALLELVRLIYSLEDKPVEVFNRRFPNPLGVAAGVDKNACLPALWQAAGFGFYEAGTVTPLRQSGNPRPRLFRIPHMRALINTLGFNNAGARAMRDNLERWPRTPRDRFPIGISLGTRKETPRTVQYALHDYGVLLVELYDYGGYFVINVSSPNTPGLRGLQEPESILRLVRGVVEQVRELAGGRSEPPKSVLVKFAPDFPSNDALIESVQAAVEGGAGGVVLFNTTQDRPRRHQYLKLADKPGGYSGPHTIDTTINGVGRVHQRFPSLPIIGVGGIVGGGGLSRVLDAGATLAQIHTAIPYQGLRAAHNALSRTRS